MQLPTELAIIYYALKGNPPRAIEYILLGVTNAQIRSALYRGRKRGECIPLYATNGLMKSKLVINQLPPN